MASPSYQTLQTQLQSARKSILFMETEHASTLKGLHNEIQQLQKKLSDATFNLAMRSEDNRQPDSNKQSQLETDIVELTNEKLQLVHQVEQRDRQLVEIEEKIGRKEMEYINEIKGKNRKISALILELDSRSSNVAYLTVQLHQAHAKLHSFKSTQAPMFSPKPPPSESRSNSRSSRRSVRSVDGDSRQCSSRESTVRMQTPENILNPVFQPGAMPDPTPFLHAGESQNETVVLPRPPAVLPPIYQQNAESLRMRSNFNLASGRQNRIKVSQVSSNLALDQNMSHKSQVPET